MIEILEKYCDDILTGVIPSGLLLKKAVERYRRDIAVAGSNTWNFREDKVKKVVESIATLKHFTGSCNGKPFILEPWQLFIIANLYGFYTPDGNRRFQTAYLEMARKQGKTALVAALAFYHVKDDDEAAAEVLFAANSKDQAKIGFNLVKGFIKGYDVGTPIMGENGKPKITRDGEEKVEYEFKNRWLDIYYDEANSFIKVLAADSDKLDGYNCSFGVVDEYHSAPDSQVRDVIRSSQGMRSSPLLVTITTAGFDKSLPCYELHTICTEILSDVKQDDSFFGVIYSLDEEDDWRDENVWVKSNPNLGITIKKDFIQKQVQQAINSPSDEVGVKTKNLNIWCDTATVWIPDEYILQSSKKVDMKDYIGETCYVGVDLSSNIDLTAVGYLFVKEGIYYFKIDYYIPHDTLHTGNLKVDRELYKNWVRSGYLKETPGNVTDYDYVTRDLLAAGTDYDIGNIYYDQYNATQWSIQCTEEGLPLLPFSQTIGNFNKCTKEFERLMLGGKIIIDDNPINRYCLRNVELRYDFNGNCKPKNDNKKKKIDGVIASLQALAAYIDATSDYKGTNIF